MFARRVLILRVAALVALGQGMVSAWASASASTSAVSESDLQHFETHVRPVLVERCYECHADKKQKGDLRLDSREGWKKGGSHGPAVVPGQPDQSPLITAVRYGNPDLQMPPHKRLSTTEVAELVEWVKRGAPDPRNEPAGPALAASEVPSPDTFWAFQPVKASGLPEVRRASWVRTPVDAFILAGLESNGLEPSPPASRRDLIRRVTFDLLGLPPTAEDVAAFEADTAPDAFDRLMERLLASPHYGERWGRWWLDVARYADTNGQDENKVLANAWRYRDWVVRAFNRNQRFDQFVMDQLAGDLLPAEGTEAEQFDRLIATGFLVLGPKMLAEQDKPKLVMDIVDEQIDTVGRTFLGLTLGCARCHDHKFDPIPARDYYALAGVFKSTRTMENLDFVSKFNERRIATRAEVEAYEAHEKELRESKSRIDALIRDADRALAAAWKQQFPEALAAVLRPQDAPATSAAVDAPLLERLRSATALDPATNAISRVLHELAREPGSAARLLTPDAKTSAAGEAPGPRLGRGRIEAGFRATGTNFIEVPHAEALEPAQLTVETWVRVDAFPDGGDKRRWLVGKNGNEWEEGHYALILDGRRPGAYLNIGGGRDHVFLVIAEGTKLEARRWHHLAATYDGDQLRLFVDGKLVEGRVIGRARVPGRGPLALGRRQDGYVHFKGDLDEVRVFGRALGAAEILREYEHPEGPTPDAVVARWEFNDLTPDQRDGLRRTEQLDVLLGGDGPLTVPKDARALYPPSTRLALAGLEREREAIEARAPSTPGYALAVAEDKPVDVPVHLRGSHLQLAKDPVPRGFLQAVARANPPPAIPAERSGRMELARWLVSPKNPLTARVLVNRIWQAHFSEGLVRSPDNFGVRGERPTHPELLDWLADRFVQSGWDVQALHRLILRSATYQQAAVASQSGQVDPDNRLLHGYPRRRLDAEMIRDSLLAVSGRLDRSLGGSLVQWKNNEYTPSDEVSAGSVRRTLYLPIVRDRVYDALTLFDFANPSVTTARRVPTVVSQQALFFMNSPLVRDSASGLASTLVQRTDLDESARIDEAYRRTLGRGPSASERARALQFVRDDAARPVVPPEPEAEPSASDGARPWAALCQALLASNEFIYRP